MERIPWFESTRAHQPLEIPVIYLPHADRPPWASSGNARKSPMARPTLLSVGLKLPMCLDFGVCPYGAHWVPKAHYDYPRYAHDLSVSPGASFPRRLGRPR